MKAGRYLLVAVLAAAVVALAVKFALAYPEENKDYCKQHAYTCWHLLHS